MRTYCIAQGTLLNALVMVYMGEKNPENTMDICIRINNSFCYMVENNTLLQSTYTPI